MGFNWKDVPEDGPSEISKEGETSIGGVEIDEGV
jgi:hypothetical protein